MRKITNALLIALLLSLILVNAEFYIVKAQNSTLIAPILNPSQGTLDKGNHIRLTSSVITTGTPPYEYQWFSEAPGESSYSLLNNAIYGATSPSYDFVGTGPTVTGTWSFILQVTDSTGAAVNSTAVPITLNQVLGVSFSGCNWKTQIYVNDQITITAHVTGGEPPYVYQLGNKLILEYPQKYNGQPYFLPTGPNWTALPTDDSVIINLLTSLPGTYIIQFDANDNSTANANGSGSGDAVIYDVLPLTTVPQSPTPAPAQSIALLSPQNQNYTKNAIPLNFTLSLPVQWVGYSLDSQANVTVTGNTTIAGLSYGMHSLIVYANDTEGNMGASQTVRFAVAEPINSDPKNSETFPTVTVATVSAASALVVGAVSVFYFKKQQ